MDLIHDERRLSPENRLLLCCARSNMEDSVREETEKLCNADLDWGMVANNAVLHRVSDFLHHNRKILHNMPRGIANLFEIAYKVNEWRYATYLDELQRILDLMEDAGIRVIVTKGPLIATKIYENPALRIFGDTDLFIEKANTDIVDRILRKEGYSYKDEGFGVEGWQKRDYNMKFSKPASPLLRRPELEFHVHKELMWKESSIDDQALWENSVKVRVANHYRLLPCNEHLLLYFLDHAEGHMRWPGGWPWIILRRFTDINEHIHSLKDKLDWGKFIDFVKADHLEESAYYPLYFTELLYGRQVPDWVIDEIRPSDADKEKDVHEMFWRPLLTEVTRVYWKSDFVSRLFNLQREQEILEVYNEILNSVIRSDEAKGWNRTILISPALPWGHYAIIVKDGRCSYSFAAIDKADIVIEISWDFWPLYKGSMRFVPLKLADEGFIKIEGSRNDIFKLMKVFFL